ncbi:hypothetical protein FGO68_gene14732 [Halteria grandinella]|uniref:Uncharacterized protein n=1 Tax=Halteria grandinella TaxID=5974 RepID=A0A8J8NGV0_HALGN|nr:hypothetical protein FGO68_gene14732 [Halteria grandinella]
MAPILKYTHLGQTLQSDLSGLPALRQPLNNNQHIVETLQQNNINHISSQIYNNEGGKQQNQVNHLRNHLKKTLNSGAIVGGMDYYPQNMKPVDLLAAQKSSGIAMQNDFQMSQFSFHNPLLQQNLQTSKVASSIKKEGEGRLSTLVDSVTNNLQRLSVNPATFLPVVRTSEQRDTPASQQNNRVATAGFEMFHTYQDLLEDSQNQREQTMEKSIPQQLIKIESNSLNAATQGKNRVIPVSSKVSDMSQNIIQNEESKSEMHQPIWSKIENEQTVNTQNQFVAQRHSQFAEITEEVILPSNSGVDLTIVKNAPADDHQGEKHDGSADYQNKNPVISQMRNTERRNSQRSENSGQQSIIEDGFQTAYQSLADLNQNFGSIDPQLMSQIAGLDLSKQNSKLLPPNSINNAPFKLQQYLIYSHRQSHLKGQGSLDGGNLRQSLQRDYNGTNGSIKFMSNADSQQYFDANDHSSILLGKGDGLDAIGAPQSGESPLEGSSSQQEISKNSAKLSSKRMSHKREPSLFYIKAQNSQHRGLQGTSQDRLKQQPPADAKEVEVDEGYYYDDESDNLTLSYARHPGAAGRWGRCIEGIWRDCCQQHAGIPEDSRWSQ